MSSNAPVTAQIRLPDQSAVRFSGVRVGQGKSETLHDIDLGIERNTTFGIASNDHHTLKVMAELIAAIRTPDAGSISVVGFDASKEQSSIFQRVGYLSFPHDVPPYLRVGEYLSLRAGALGVPKDRWEPMIDTLLTLAGIAGRQKAYTHDLASANRQLLGVAATLVHDPGVVVLHEPTEGLDARASSRLWNMLRRLNDVSRTVIVCSAKFSELSANCASVAVLDGGQIVDSGAPSDVVGRLSGARKVRARLTSGVVRTHTVADANAQAALLKKLVDADIGLIEFSEVPPELDDLGLVDHSTRRAAER